MLFLIVFFPFAAAFAVWLTGRKHEAARDNLAIAVSAAELLLVLCLFAGDFHGDIPVVLFSGLHFVTDGFRKIYALITAIMWAGTSVFSKEYFEEEREGLNRYWFFVLVTLGATEGVMLSADLMTAFVFFELLSFTSFTWVIHEETAPAIRAGYTYLFVAVIGGLILFMGLILILHSCGTLVFAELSEAARETSARGELFAGGLCVLLGFGAKAGMFPLHIWLPKAHPIAPSPASALLSGILTKVGIYGILMISLNAFLTDAVFGVIVLCAGLITMVLGAVLALFSVNLKRTLACSSMSQIGFILTGLGMTLLLQAAGSEEAAGEALCGVVLHMVNHSLIKLVLFMCAGVVIMKLHTLTLDDIRGFGRRKPLFMASFALGAAGISGIPMFNGYISKTLLHESIVAGAEAWTAWHGLLSAAEWVFLISGGCTFASMLKLFICIFVEKHPTRQAEFDADTRGMNPLSTAVIFGSSLLMVILGQPGVSRPLAAYMTGTHDILHFAAFSPVNLKGGLISLGIGALLYLVLVRRVLMRNGSYINLWPENLDLEDLVYRPVLTKLLPGIFGPAAAIFGENRVLGRILPAAFQGLLDIMGSNDILMDNTGFSSSTTRPSGLMLALSVFAKLLLGTLDETVFALRHSVMREKKAAALPEHGSTRRIRLRQAIYAGSQLYGNFSYALIMTCVGILLILTVILISANLI